MQLSAVHWVYLAGVVMILLTMVARKNIVVPAVMATFAVAVVFSGEAITGISSVFNASLVAAENLFNIFLIIALVTAMLHSLQALGADRKMVVPFRRVIRNGHSAFWVLFAVAYFMSLFFWPTPTVPLLGAVLVPVAIRAGLRPMAVGVVIACAGQGMALSSDYVMRVAPGLSARAGGLDANVVSDKAMVLSLVTGAVALSIAYIREIRHMRKPSQFLLDEWEASGDSFDAASSEPKAAGLGPAQQGSEAEIGSRAEQKELVGAAPSAGGPPVGHGAALQGADSVEDAFPAEGSRPHPRYRVSTAFAIFVPLAYLSLIVYMVLAKVSDAVPDLEAGDAAALVGGMAALIVFIATLAGDGRRFLETSASHVVNGLVFAFKAMGVVSPIAGFFFIGNGEFSGEILGMEDGADGPEILFDLVGAAQQHIPDNPFVAAFGILLIGMVAGLEGSGFSGLPLTGSLSGSLGSGTDISATSLAALGQMGNVWSGGGALVAWSSLIAVAGFARVPVLDLARRCFLPVVCGLCAAAVVAMIVLG